MSCSAITKISPCYQPCFQHKPQHWIPWRKPTPTQPKQSHIYTDIFFLYHEEVIRGRIFIEVRISRHSSELDIWTECKWIKHSLIAYVGKCEFNLTDKIIYSVSMWKLMLEQWSHFLLMRNLNTERAHKWQWISLQVSMERRLCQKEVKWEILKLAWLQLNYNAEHSHLAGQITSRPDWLWTSQERLVKSFQGTKIGDIALIDCLTTTKLLSIKTLNHLWCFMGRLRIVLLLSDLEC